MTATEDNFRLQVHRLPYTTIENAPVIDPGLSLAAKGLLAVYAVLEGREGDRVVTDAAVAAACRDSPEVVAAAMAELVAAGEIAIGAEAQALADARAAKLAAELAENEASFAKVIPASQHPLRQRRPHRRAKPGSVVYYIQRPHDGAVKIGTTGNIKKRLKAIDVEHGPVLLLATEQGEYGLEDERHEQFSAHRIRGEWFRPAGPLMEHVTALAGAEAGR